MKTDTPLGMASSLEAIVFPLHEGGIAGHWLLFLSASVERRADHFGKRVLWPTKLSVREFYGANPKVGPGLTVAFAQALRGNPHEGSKLRSRMPVVGRGAAGLNFICHEIYLLSLGATPNDVATPT